MNTFIYSILKLISMEITAFDTSILVKELGFLVGGKIDNIYQTDSKNLYLQTYIKDKPKQLIRIVAGKAFFLTKNRPDFPENILRFCSFLRKYLINSRIKKIEQIEYERILRIEFETKDCVYELYSEFFGKGNILLTKNNIIISTAEEQIWHDRKINAGEKYIFPKNDRAKEFFEEQKKKGSKINFEILDNIFSVEKAKKSSKKDKEMKRLLTIIDKQEEQLDKAVKEAEENKKKGELIYENYQKLKEIISESAESKKSKEKRIVVELK